MPLIRRCVGLMCLAAAFMLPAAAGSQPSAVHLRLVTSANDDATPALFAQANGMFRAVGLDVEIQAISNGPVIAAAIASGTAEVGRASVLAIAVARSRGLPFTIVAPSGLVLATEATEGLVVPKDSPLSTARDLASAIVSVPNLSEVAALSARAWIDKNGGDSQSIHFVEVPGSQVALALDTGRINAAVMLQPLLAQNIASGKYRVLGDPGSSIGPRILAAVWFASSTYVAKNPEIIKRFAAVLDRASKYCNAHPQQTIDLLAKFSGLDPATIAKMHRVQYATSLDPRDIQPLLDAAFRYKIIPAPTFARDLLAN
jgi:ABC-type nitrate/sulfonate/bicarbonate transport system substrate-binding protein